MNWEAIGAIAEGLGAAGVIITLVYLATQIRQNTAALRRTEMNVAMEQFGSFRKLLLSNETFPRIFLVGQADLELLNDNERFNFELLMLELFHLFRHQYDRSVEGVVKWDEWKTGAAPHVTMVLEQKGAGAWWRENAATFPDLFVNEVERLVSS
jgi:hypothetical protein